MTDDGLRATRENGRKLAGQWWGRLMSYEEHAPVDAMQASTGDPVRYRSAAETSGSQLSAGDESVLLRSDVRKRRVRAVIDVHSSTIVEVRRGFVDWCTIFVHSSTQTLRGVRWVELCRAPSAHVPSFAERCSQPMSPRSELCVP